MTHEHHRWLEEASASIQNDWIRQRDLAKEAGRTQQVGHEHETTWAKFLKNWLPPQYEVSTRKYIVGTQPEQTKPFETDIVIFHPGYPQKLREESHVMASGVAAAFSVKLTIKPAGLLEAAHSSASLQRSLIPRTGDARTELWKPFLYGVLAGSHDWKAPNSTPIENISKILSDNDDVAVVHPAESLDLVCVADLGVWAKDIALSADYSGPAPRETLTASHQEVFHSRISPLSVFLSSLYERLSWQDNDLRGLAHDFRVTSGWEGSSGLIRNWEPTSVLTADALLKMRSYPFPGASNEPDSRFQSLS